MQKKTILTNFLFLFLFLLSTTSFAQTRIIDLDNDGILPIVLPTSGGMVTITTPIVRVANLIPDGHSGNYILPPGTQPIYLKFEGPNNSLFIPVNSFSFLSFINGYPVYKMNPVDILVDVSGLCDNQGGYFGFNYNFSLVTIQDDPYPIHDVPYMYPNGIFSCKVFVLTCMHCRETNFNCSNIEEAYPISYFTATLDCHDNASTKSPGESGNTTEPSNTKAILHSANVSPNPFDDQFRLMYQLEEDAEVKITIYNSQGQVVRQNNSLQPADLHMKTFNTDRWATGIYYFRIQTNNSSQFLKIVKAK